MGKDLFKKTLYTNKDFNSLKGTIREYDMKDAGFSIIKNDMLLPLDTLAYLEELDKVERKIAIGKMMRKDKVLNRKLTEGFSKYIELFIKANKIPDTHILSIKKDAVFIINMTTPNDTFGQVKFALKNRYTSYYYINKVEFYFNSMTKKLDIKGIHDDNLKKHKKYMIKFFKNIFTQIELGNKETAILTLKKFADKYRRRELPVGYYREFNSYSEFRIKDICIGDMEYSVSDFRDDLTLDNVEINHNYMKYIVNICRILYK